MNTLYDSSEIIYNYYKNLKETNKITPYNRFCENLFQTFQVDVGKLIEMKFVVCKQLNQAWSEFDKLPYWEMEAMVDHLKTWIEKEKEAQEKEEGKSSKLYNKDTFMKDTQGMARKYGVPSGSSIKAPAWNTSSNFKPPNLTNFKI